MDEPELDVGEGLPSGRVLLDGVRPLRIWILVQEAIRLRIRTVEYEANGQRFAIFPTLIFTAHAHLNLGEVTGLGLAGIVRGGGGGGREERKN